MPQTHPPIAPPAKKVLSLGLTDRIGELSTALLAPGLFESIGSHGPWLRDRYREILPAVLPDALRAMETGARIESTSLRAIRGSAHAMWDAQVPVSVVLRGGIPAMRMFSSFIHSRETGLGPRDLTLLMGRAALIAGELGACWAESWAQTRAAADSARSLTDGDSLDLVAVPGTVQSPALEMLALVASGHSNDQIALETDYSPQAVKWHLARVMRLWKVENRASLVAVALVRGVLVARPNRPAPTSSVDRGRRS